MSAGNFDACLAVTLKEEGGWSDNPKDPGRATNLGVTQATWQTFVGKSRVVTTADIKALTVADVTPLYGVFWKGCAGEYLPAGVDLATFDWCVNSGSREGNKGLQEALKVPADGLVGPVTINTATAADHSALVDAICDGRAAFYRSLPADEFAEFGRGWLDRVEAIRAAAKAMVAA